MSSKTHVPIGNKSGWYTYCGRETAKLTLADDPLKATCKCCAKNARQWVNAQKMRARARANKAAALAKAEEQTGAPSGALASYHAMGDCDGPGLCPLCG